MNVRDFGVIYIYPRSGRPGVPLLPGWDETPGARGCTPQSCAFRDAHGFRPLVLGRIHEAGSAAGQAAARPDDRAGLGGPGQESADGQAVGGAGDWVVASETCALDLVGAEFVREVERGEAVLIDDDGLRSVRAVEPADGGALCIFEFFYLARPDTRLDGIEVHGARVRMGEQLAVEAPADVDLVLPIPDSGTPAAIGFSRAIGVPFSEGLIKNRYIARTFIQPDQALRALGVRLKFNPLAEVAGKRVAVVDDSIVRGNTTRQIVQMLFDAGAAEVHVRISSPPVIGQCFYGIDLADPDEMIAGNHSVEEIRELIGATSLAYLSHDGLVAATRRPESALCRACLTGEYPTAVPVEHAKLRFEKLPA